MLSFVFRRGSAIQFFVIVNFSNVLQGFIMSINLRVFLFVFVRLFFVFCCCVVTNLYLPTCRSFFTVVYFNFSGVWLTLINLLVVIYFCESGIGFHICLSSFNRFREYVLISACWGLTSNLIFVLHGFAVCFSFRCWVVSLVMVSMYVLTYVLHVVYCSCHLFYWVSSRLTLFYAYYIYLYFCCVIG